MATARNAVPARMDKTKPIYRVLEKSFIDDKLLDPELMPLDQESEQPKPLLIEFEGDPGYNLEPWNELADKKWASIHAKGAPKRVDPIAELTQVR